VTFVKDSEDLTTSSTQQIFLDSRYGSSSMESCPKKQPLLVVNIQIMWNLDTDMQSEDIDAYQEFFLKCIDEARRELMRTFCWWD